VRLVALILYYVVWLFLIVLLVRLVFDWVQALAREWRPRGVVLVVAEAVYTVTDPPLRALRRLIPPLTLGASGSTSPSWSWCSCAGCSWEFWEPLGSPEHGSEPTRRAKSASGLPADLSFSATVWRGGQRLPGSEQHEQPR